MAAVDAQCPEDGRDSLARVRLAVDASRVLAAGLSFEEALRVCDEALAASADADSRDAAPMWRQRAIACRGLGDANAAAEALRRAVALDASVMREIATWIQWLQSQANTSEALIELLRAWTACVADDAFAWHALGMSLLTAPGFRRNGEACGEALQALRRAQVIDPLIVPTQSLALSGALEMNRRWHEAEAVLRPLLGREPDNAPAWNNLSGTLRHTGRSDEALVAARRALGWPSARATMALALLDCHRFDEAAQFLDATLTAQPGDANARVMRGELHLRRGEWARGWADLEGRFGLPGLDAAHRHFRRNGTTPEWRGEALHGRRLCVWMEQGFGDSILLARFVPALVERVQREGGTLMLSVFAPLRSLLRPMVPEGIALDAVDVQGADFHLPLMSLPAAMAVEAHGHSGAAYLHAPADRLAHWSARVASASGNRRRISLVWKGQPDHVRDAFRSMPPAALAPLLTLPDTTFFVLDPRQGEAPNASGASSEVIDWTSGLRDFADTAALVASLDAVVTVDTAVAHLAGAVGVPTFVMIDRLGAWLWRDDDRSTPWYRSMRIVRQTRMCEWSDVAASVRDQVAALPQRRDTADRVGQAGE